MRRDEMSAGSVMWRKLGTLLAFVIACGTAAADPASVNNLLAQGMPVNALNDAGESPWMLAGAGRKASVVKILLEHKADLSAVEPTGHQSVRAVISRFAATNGDFANLAKRTARRGNVEYRGAVLPASPYAAELQGMEQIDVTKAFYGGLSFLKPGWRFLAAAREIPQRPGEPRWGHDFHAQAYAVRPNGSVIKLAGVADFAKLGIRMHTSSHALQLSNFLLQPWSDENQRIVLVFRDAELVEVPRTDDCFSVAFDSFSADEAHSVKVQQRRGSNGRKVFIITRYGVPRSTFPEPSDDYRVQALFRLTEIVREDGSYTQTFAPVAHSGFEAKFNCRDIAL